MDWCISLLGWLWWEICCSLTHLWIVQENSLAIMEDTFRLGLGTKMVKIVSKLWSTPTLTAWSRFILEKLTSSQLVKKFPGFHGTRRFITAFTSARHLSLSWARLIQPMPPHPTSWRSMLILSSHLCLGLPSGLFPSGFPTKTLYTPLLSLIHALPISFFSIWSPKQYWMRSTDH